MQKDGLKLRTGEEIPFSALNFATSRGGGPGGQNVNKVETRVEVKLNLQERPELSERSHDLLLKRLGNKLDSEGNLRLVSSTERSQHGNRAAVVRRLEEMLNAALKPRKKRIPTKPSKAARERRIEKKKALSQKKEGRRWRPE